MRLKVFSYEIYCATKESPAINRGKARFDVLTAKSTFSREREREGERACAREKESDGK